MRYQGYCILCTSNAMLSLYLSNNKTVKQIVTSMVYILDKFAYCESSILPASTGFADWLSSLSLIARRYGQPWVCPCAWSSNRTEVQQEIDQG